MRKGPTIVRAVNLLAGVAIILIVAHGAASAQSPASVSWPLTNPGTGGTGLQAFTSGLVQGWAEQFGTMEVNQYTGPDTSQRVRPAGTNNTWPADTAQVESRFIQFAVAPVAGVTFRVTHVSMKLGANSTSALRANLWWSTDSSFAGRTLLNPSPLVLPNTAMISPAPDYTIDVSVADSQKFYLRIYPWSTASSSGKYICPQAVSVEGTTTGTAVVSLPTISTASVMSISTTFATAGGVVTSDGGGTIVSRGVCWNTTGAPTIVDSLLAAGGETGLFTVTVLELLPGTTYALRAYATNSAGTAYGEERSFTTLSALSVPTLTTATPSSILVTTATCGGTVTAWGGDTVKARGVCWNTTGTPTILDAKTEDGTGIGVFASGLTGLSALTGYSVRAYATNSVGTGYGNEVSFTTQTPAPDVRKIVSQDGSGDYTSVQAAFDAVPLNYTGRYIIEVRKGTYKEKLLLGPGKINVILLGEGRDSTILTYDDYSGKVVGGVTLATSTCYSVSIDAADFVAMNITFQNTSTAAQAVALETNGDRQSYFNCRMLGYQDTYYTRGSSKTDRIYNRNCQITGSVDFIFGRDIVVFDSCTITENRNAGTLTAASTETGSRFGYVFLNCTIAADSIGYDGTPITSFYLGRPWQAAPRTVFINCVEPAMVHPAGWLAWNVPPALYAEYLCSGPGAPSAQRVSWSAQLSDSAASTYTLANIFSRTATSPDYAADWMPVMPDVQITTSAGRGSEPVVPVDFSLAQNFPNPFNPSTAIEFTVAQSGRATLSVWNVLGQRIATLFDGVAVAGRRYDVRWNADHASSGTYFSILESAGRRDVKRMLLVR